LEFWFVAIHGFWGGASAVIGFAVQAEPVEVRRVLSGVSFWIGVTAAAAAAGSAKQASAVATADLLKLLLTSGSSQSVLTPSLDARVACRNRQQTDPSSLTDKLQ
jgi:hypothetical protein